MEPETSPGLGQEQPGEATVRIPPAAPQGHPSLLPPSFPACLTQRQALSGLGLQNPPCRPCGSRLKAQPLQRWPGDSCPSAPGPSCCGPAQGVRGGSRTEGAQAARDPTQGLGKSEKPGEVYPAPPGCEGPSGHCSPSAVLSPVVLQEGTGASVGIKQVAGQEAQEGVEEVFMQESDASNFLKKHGKQSPKS
ncbi:hypothetical protein MC885_001433 [Smutsia gigantea]|nr:hypothetical protein MC885_001433 [Smutsia gigantea]